MPSIPSPPAAAFDTTLPFIVEDVHRVVITQTIIEEPQLIIDLNKFTTEYASSLVKASLLDGKVVWYTLVLDSANRDVFQYILQQSYREVHTRVGLSVATWVHSKMYPPKPPIPKRSTSIREQELKEADAPQETPGTGLSEDFFTDDSPLQLSNNQMVHLAKRIVDGMDRFCFTQEPSVSLQHGRPPVTRENAVASLLTFVDKQSFLEMHNGKKRVRTSGNRDTTDEEIIGHFRRRKSQERSMHN